MNLKAILAAAATVMIISIPGAVAQMQGMDMQKMMPQADDTASTKDMKQAHMEMMKNMNLDFTGNPDVDFARSMVKHHESAIVMARSNSSTERILKFAKWRKKSSRINKRKSRSSIPGSGITRNND